MKSKVIHKFTPFFDQKRIFRANLQAEPPGRTAPQMNGFSFRIRAGLSFPVRFCGRMRSFYLIYLRKAFKMKAFFLPLPKLFYTFGKPNIKTKLFQTFLPDKKQTNLMHLFELHNKNLTAILPIYHKRIY
jgi:hypothetical protein